LVSKNYDMVASQSETTQEIVDSYDAFVFDCDGVVWKGSESIDGVSEAINKLTMTKHVLFATNNSMHMPEELITKLESIGIKDVKSQNVICPANVLPDVVEELTDNDDVISVFGTPALTSGLQKKLNASRVIEWSSLEEKYFKNMKPSDVMACLGDIELKELPSVIVLGYDPEFSYVKLCWVIRVCHLRELKNLKTTVLKSNSDITFPTKWGLLPGAGSICIPYENALKNFTLVTVRDCGKPEKTMADIICQRTGKNKNRIAMVGDNLLTDIKFGNNHLGCSILVETGIHGPSDTKRLDIYPTYIIKSAAELC